MGDKISGQVAYAVMFGIGESYHLLPWRVLKFDLIFI